MSRASTKMLKTALSALHYSGLGSLFAPLTRGQGVIFTLHQVVPEERRPFDPNGILRVTPQFLEAVVIQVRDAGFDFVSLDEAEKRISGDIGSGRPFACFTFDDGYRDNRVHAHPILKRHGVPFTIYVPTDFPDGRGELWWLALEEVVRRSPAVIVQMAGTVRNFPCLTTADKKGAYDSIYWWLRGLPEDRSRQVVRELAAGAGVDIGAICRDLIMTWDEIRELATDPQVTIGAHTCRHYAVARLAADEARSEIANSIRRVEEELGRPCRHFSFPYGDETSASPRDFQIAADLGVATAVTTRKGLIQGGGRDELTGLPRVSLNGDYQHGRYVEVLLTGAPFAFWNLFRRERAVAP
ncbi:MAG: polysaccharide deacetylase family protein [Hyphomicrobiaceae bacterium]